MPDSLIERKLKPELLNERLTRPDWTSGITRDPALLWLDKNENTDPAFNRLASKVVSSIDQKAIHTYPETANLYKKLAQWVGVTPRHLLLTPGSDGAIRCAFDAFVRPGDAVIHSAPTFAMYPVYCQIFGAKAFPLAYEPGPEGPTLTVEKICDALNTIKPKLFCLPNPDSPTGSVVEADGLRKILETAGQHGTWVLIDEAYHPFLKDTVVPWIADYPHLMVARTFSKAWGLAGARVGYLVAHPDLTAYLHKMRPMYEIGSVSACIVENMLDHADEMMASVGRLEEGKNYFITEMEKLKFRCLPSKGNFLHVAFGSRAEKIHRALKPIVLYRLDFMEPSLRGFSRFSSTTVENFRAVVETISVSAS